MITNWMWLESSRFIFSPHVLRCPLIRANWYRRVNRLPNTSSWWNGYIYVSALKRKLASDVNIGKGNEFETIICKHVISNWLCMKLVKKSSHDDIIYKIIAINDQPPCWKQTRQTFVQNQEVGLSWRIQTFTKKI